MKRNSKAKVTILGLGPGDAGFLTMEAERLLQEVEEIHVRTARHPVVSSLPPRLRVHSFDYVYETKDTFAEVYRTICDEVLRLAERPEGVVYAVPGHPLVAEESVRRILAAAKERGVHVRIVPGLSFLDPLLTSLELDPLAQGLQLADATALAEYADALAGSASGERDYQGPLVWSRRPLDPAVPAIVCQLHSQRVASAVKLALLEVYPHDHRVILVRWAGIAGKEKKRTLVLSDLDRRRDIDHLTSLFLPPLAVLDDLSSIAGLRYVIARLRAPGGCPWDREQTHESLKPYLVEEAYEVLDALDANDPAKLGEELGDLLLQIVLHAQLAAETGEFMMEDVYRHINAKLIRRHPHVFGEVKVTGASEVLRNWEQIKREEKGSGLTSLDNLPKGMPALAYAQSMQRRVARIGFDWREIGGVVDKVAEEVKELTQATDHQEKAQELGDILFALVNLARWLNVDAEEALRQSSQKFRRRFQRMEQLCAERGLELGKLSLEEQDKLWEEVKGMESTRA